MSGGNFPLQTILNANPAYLRTDLGDLGNLTRSIKRGGLHAPILVDSSYLILDGARRVEALKRMRADSVWCVATNEWEVVRNHLLDSAARHDAGDEYKPKSYLDIVEIMPYLSRLKRIETGARASASRKISKTQPAEKPEDYGTIGTAAVAFGYPATLVRVLSAIGSRLRTLRLQGQHEVAARVVEAVIKGEQEQLVTALTNAVEHAIDPTVRLAARPGYAKRVYAEFTEPLELGPRMLGIQAKLITRTLESLVGALQALPQQEEVATNHSESDIAAWLKQMSEFTTITYRLKKRLNLSMQGREDESEDNREGAN